MLRKLAIILIALTSQPVAAEMIREASKTKLVTEQIMAYFVEEQFVEGIDIAKKFWPLPPAELDGLANQIATQWEVVKQRYGNTTGHEFLRVDRLGSSFVRLYYLHKFDNHAIYWRFTFYKPEEGWVINGITFQDDLHFLFETVK